MKVADKSLSKYDNRTIMYHWLMAVLITVQWLGAHIIDWFPKGALRIDARSCHIVLGVAIATLLVFRIMWRLRSGRRLQPVNEGALDLLAKTVHRGLYFLIALMVVVGLVLAWVRGDNIFNLFQIPTIVAHDSPLRDQVGEIHIIIGWIIVGFVGVHTMAALGHHYIWRDRTLSRMWFGRDEVK